jgi:FKBP-type peptidyl-prolyl cis-trans isomerase
MLKQISKLSFAAFLLLIAADPQTQPANQRTTDSGLTIVEVQQQPEQLAAQAGDMVGVEYTGKLQSNGEKFDSSLDRPRQEPLWFRLGANQVIKGWDEGLVGMKVGDKRQLIIPPSLAYGDKGTPGGPIPPNATLIFDVQLVGIFRQPN